MLRTIGFLALFLGPSAMPVSANVLAPTDSQSLAELSEQFLKLGPDSNAFAAAPSSTKVCLLELNTPMDVFHRINQGSIPDLSPPETESDFYFVQADDPATAVGRIIELVKTRIPNRFGLDPIRDIQVLCPMNRGGVGARSLNIELQAALNPAGDRKVEPVRLDLCSRQQDDADQERL